MRKFSIKLLVLFAFCQTVLFVACEKENPQNVVAEETVFIPLKEISYPEAEENLLNIVKDVQMDEVWPGGNEYNGSYTDLDKQRFLGSNYVQKIRNRMVRDRNFLESILALKNAEKDSVDNLILRIQEYRTYITWQEIGSISQYGTTEAGSQVQLEISFTIAVLIKEFILLEEDHIKSIWEEQYK